MPEDTEAERGDALGSQRSQQGQGDTSSPVSGSDRDDGHSDDLGSTDDDEGGPASSDIDPDGMLLQPLGQLYVHAEHADDGSEHADDGSVYPPIDIVYVCTSLVVSPESEGIPKGNITSEWRELVYKLPLGDVLLGDFTEKSIHRHAHSLLHGLAQARQGDLQNRTIVFAAFEFGGLVLKKAISEAAKNRIQYPGIFDSTARVIFNNCLQRNKSHESLMLHISTFPKYYTGEEPPLGMTVTVSRGLSNGISQTSEDFLQSRVSLQSKIISVYRPSDALPGKSQCATLLGLLSEITVKRDDQEPNSWANSVVSEVLSDLNAWSSNPAFLERIILRRAMISLSATERCLTRGPTKLEAWPCEVQKLSEAPFFRKWQSMVSSFGELVLLYGESHSALLSTANFLLQRCVQDLEEGRFGVSETPAVFAFEFDVLDSTRNSMTAMITTVLAEMMGRAGWIDDQVYGLLASYFITGTEWTIKSLLHALFSSRLHDETAILLLHKIDECDAESRQHFFNHYQAVAESCEQFLRVIVMTKEPESISKRSDNWTCIHVDDLNASLDLPWASRVAAMEQLYPFPEEKSQIRSAIDRIASVGLRDATTVLDLIQSYSQWPKDTSQKHFHTFLEFADTCSSTDTTSSVLDRLLRSSAELELIQWVITWLYLSHCRLTRTELIAVLSESIESKLASVQLPHKQLETLKKGIQRLLHLLVESDGDELILRSEVRYCFANKSKEASAYVWEDLELMAHTVIADLTLHHLNLPASKQALEDTTERYISWMEHVDDSPLKGLVPALSPDTLDVTFKLLQSLPHHLSQIKAKGTSSPASAVILKLSQASASVVLLWTRAYWTTCNPFTRGPDPATSSPMEFLDFSAIMRGRLDDSVETRRTRYLTASEQPEKTPPGPCSPSTSGENIATPCLTVSHIDKMEALFTSLRASDRDVAIVFAQEIVNDSKTSGDEIAWPLQLIWTASSQNMAGFLSLLLSNGADPEASGDHDRYLSSDQLGMIRRYLVTPLFEASRLGNTAAVNVLLGYGARMDVHSCDDVNTMVMNVAADNGQLGVFNLLVQQDKALLDDTDKMLDLAYGAAGRGSVPVLREILLRIIRNHDELAVSADDATIEQRKARSDLLNGIPKAYNWTPLMLATDHGCFNAAALLLEAGVDPNRFDPAHDGTTPLWKGVWKWPNLDMTRKLLKHGGDPYQHVDGVPLLLKYIMNSTTTSNGSKAVLFDLEILDALLEATTSRIVDITTEGTLETALMIASSAGSLPIVKWLLSNGADYDLKDDRGRTALWHAVVNGHAPVVEELLGQTPAPELDLMDSDNNEASILSIASNSVEITNALLDAGVNVNVRNGDGSTAIDAAICASQSDVVRTLIDRGADLTIGDKGGWSPLATACLFNHADEVRMLVDAGASPDDFVGGQNLAHHAAFSSKTLQIILEFGNRVDVNHHDSRSWTPLMRAATYVPEDNSAEHIKLLLRAGANVNAKSDDGKTALFIATQEDRSIASLQVLLATPGIQVDTSDSRYWTPLLVACNLGKIEAVKMLLDHGADVNYIAPCSALCPTPLISATLLAGGRRNEDAGTVDDMVRLLVDCDADVAAEYPGCPFANVLSSAALGCGLATIEFLLGKSPSSHFNPDHFGRRPIHYAAANGIENLKAIYQGDKRNLFAPDHGLKTVVHWAAQFGNAQALEWILTKHAESGSAEPITDMADTDGWTPLCWALRPLQGGLSPEMRSEPRDYAGVVRILLSAGARCDQTFCLGRGKEDEQNMVDELTPIQIAHRYGSEPGVIQQLIDRLEAQSADAGNSDESQNAKEAEASAKSRRGPFGNERNEKRYKPHPNGVCDICLTIPAGLTFSCSKCYNFLTCAKCIRNYALFHAGIFKRPEDQGELHEMILEEGDEFLEDIVIASSLPPSPRDEPTDAEDDRSENFGNSSDNADSISLMDSVGSGLTDHSDD